MDEVWPRSEDDQIEIGGSGWIPAKEGTFKNRETGQTMDAEGRIFNESGEMEFDPDEED